MTSFSLAPALPAAHGEARRDDTEAGRRFRYEAGFGAALLPEGGTCFRLWAPSADGVTLLVGPDERPVDMVRLDAGWLEAVVEEVGAGTRYRYRLADGTVFPDPASRAQDGGPFGPSVVVDPEAYRWRTAGWTGRPWEETVLYELHIGSFTRDGSFAGAERRLDALAALGVTAIELMPVADFPGRWGWGYDGVLPFAPASIYGPPQALKSLIDAAHARGISVLLDVVYNHFGPAGNFLPLYASSFFDARRRTLWGPSIDFSQPAVRAFFRENALYWLHEYRFDGLRFDAVHAIEDGSEPDILTEIAEAVAASADGRHLHLVLENDHNEADRLDGAGGPRARFSGQWNDDVHHAMHAVLTGESDGYYADYADRPTERLARGLAEGYVYQGEMAVQRGAPRGQPSAHLPPVRFVNFLQNHDQIGNRAFGDRIDAAPQALHTLQALLLLAPSIPMLFMGEESATRRPFPFFCDFDGVLADDVRRGRREEFAHFGTFSDPAMLERIPDPLDPATFASAVLDGPAPDDAVAATRQAEVAKLLTIRRTEIVPKLAGMEGGGIWRAEDGLIDVSWRLGDGSVLSIVAHLADGEAPRWTLPAGRTIYSFPAAFPEALRSGAEGWGIVAMVTGDVA